MSIQDTAFPFGSAFARKRRSIRTFQRAKAEKRNPGCAILGKTGRKAQMEIMGIAMITVLIVFGFLFFVRFSAFKDQGNNIQKDFQRSSLSSYFLDAILSTSVGPNECRNNVNFQDLIKDCVTNNDCPESAPGVPNRNCILCKEEDGDTAPFSISSCDFVENKIGEILSATLGQQGKAYRFRAGNGDAIFVEVRPDCITVQQGGFREQPLPDGVVVSMSLCEK